MIVAGESFALYPFWKTKFHGVVKISKTMMDRKRERKTTRALIKKERKNAVNDCGGHWQKARVVWRGSLQQVFAQNGAEPCLPSREAFYWTEASYLRNVHQCHDPGCF
jgi:hypothetical protein